MVIKIEVDDKFEKEPILLAMKSVAYILGELGLTKKETSDVFTRILTDIDERQKISKCLKDNYDF